MILAPHQLRYKKRLLIGIRKAIFSHRAATSAYWLRLKDTYLTNFGC